MENVQPIPLPRKLLGGLWELTHHTLTMVGLFVVAGGAFLLAHPQAVADLNHGLTQWVLARQMAAAELQALAQQPAQAVAADAAPSEPAAAPMLSAQQRAVASFLARRYSIAPAAMEQLVQSAWEVGRSEKLDPLLILAVISVESSFNPYAQSAMGATGLMQVMANVHRDKFAPFGGPQASIDPIANMRVGALVLRDAIARAGSLRAGLRAYVGASSDSTEAGYADKVLAALSELERVAGVRPTQPPLTAAAATHAAAAATTQTASTHSGAAARPDPLT